jgi:hypothetical protein
VKSHDAVSVRVQQPRAESRAIARRREAVIPPPVPSLSPFGARPGGPSLALSPTRSLGAWWASGPLPPIRTVAAAAPHPEAHQAPTEGNEGGDWVGDIPRARPPSAAGEPRI